MQFYINEAGSQQKKQRRLRKNFDLLTQAIKNSNTVKKDKKINFSQDSRAYNNTTSHLAPQIYQQNFVMQQQQQDLQQHSPQISAKKHNQIENIAQIYQYGAQIQQPFKDRKSSAYDVLVNPHHNSSQSQRVPSHHSNNSTTNHNLSLYSHISIKENSQTPQKNQGNLSYQQTRNQSMMIYQNLPNNTQPIVVSDQKQYMRVNDKLMRRFILNDNSQQQHQQAVALQNLQLNNGGTNSQAILNINTASDINIYNNSFIVNTTTKKQSHSQNQSRSNSLKRNQQQPVILGNINANAPSQRIINKQSSIQRIINQTQYNSNMNQLNGNTLLNAMQQNDYQVKYNNSNKPQSSTGRIHSNSRINSQGHICQFIYDSLFNIQKDFTLGIKFSYKLPTLLILS